MSLSLLFARADSTLAHCFQMFYAECGYAVSTATGGLDCLSQMRQSRPDVLVLDQDLPWGGADGVLAQLREEWDGSMVPVVLLSDGRSHESTTFLEAPVIARLRKPYDFSALFDCIEDAAQRNPRKQAVNLKRKRLDAGHSTRAPSAHL